MAATNVKSLLTTLVLVASISQTLGFCNLLTAKFRLFGCVTNKRFPCGLIDAKMNLLNCRQFACESYRDIQTFCTTNCRGLEIANGLCRFGTKCCLNTPFESTVQSDDSSFSIELDNLMSLQGTDKFDLISPEAGTADESLEEDISTNTV